MSTQQISMPIVAGDDPLRYPLIGQLFGKHGFTQLSQASLPGWLAQPGRALLVFLEDPIRVRETLDLAVIVPELARAFPGEFIVGVLLPADARDVAPRYSFRRWPAVVILADGQYVGAIDGLRNWDEYLADVACLLASPPTRPPTVGIAVKGDGGSAPHCH